LSSTYCGVIVPTLEVLSVLPGVELLDRSNITNHAGVNLTGRFYALCRAYRTFIILSADISMLGTDAKSRGNGEIR
jgi:hypothetical protein